MRNVLVTGGTRGIGAAIAEAFKANGDRVLSTYSKNEKAAAAFSKRTGISTLAFDVTDFDGYETKWRQVQSFVGDPDIVVANAGITADSSLRKMSADMWHDVIDTNLSSLFYLCRQAFPAMKERGWGRVITISSVNAFSGMRGQTNYAASKAGILGFTKSLAQEVAPSGITVNAIAPGYTETDMVAAVSPDVVEKIVATIPVGRLGDPKDVANAAVFLGAVESGYITGTTLHVNGGLRMD